MVHSFPSNGSKHDGLERHYDRGDPSSDTTESREPESAVQALRHQPEDGGQVAEAHLGCRCADRAEAAVFHGVVH